MATPSKREYLDALVVTAEKNGVISSYDALRVKEFAANYCNAAASSGRTDDDYLDCLTVWAEQAIEQCHNPFPFDLFHKSLREPFNYFQLGMEFIRSLVNEAKSWVLREENLHCIKAQVEKGENVIFFANHQAEADPQLLGLLIEKYCPNLAEKMIFVAGHRVTTDPIAAPLSMGCNLLCIYSKNYIDSPPEQREEKLNHNKATMRRMAQLLGEGGCCIYVAPSGGRDRHNEKGELEVAPFDPKSIAMFELMAKQGGKPTHFYPLALDTHLVFPPPSKIQQEMGESRLINYGPISAAFGDEIMPEATMDSIEGKETAAASKQEKRALRAAAIHLKVKEDFERLLLGP